MLVSTDGLLLMSFTLVDKTEVKFFATVLFSCAWVVPGPSFENAFNRHRLMALVVSYLRKTPHELPVENVMKLFNL